MSLMFDRHFCRCESELSPAQSRQLLGIYGDDLAAAEAAIDDLILDGKTSRREVSELPVLDEHGNPVNDGVG